MNLIQAAPELHISENGNLQPSLEEEWSKGLPPRSCVSIFGEPLYRLGIKLRPPPPEPVSFAQGLFIVSIPMPAFRAVQR